MWNAIATGVSSIAGIYSGNAQQKKQQQYNKELLNLQSRYNLQQQRENNYFNRQSQILANEFTDQQRQAQNQWNEQQYLRYNTPEAQKRQYLLAGLNPQLAMDSNGLANVSQSSSSGASASAAPPLGLNMPYQQVTPGTEGFQQMANALKTLGEAAKSGIETRYLEREIKERIKGMQLSNTAQDFANSINLKYLDKEKAAQLEHALNILKSDKLTLDQANEQLSILKSQKIITEKEAFHWEERFASELNNLDADTAKKDKETQNLGKDIEVKDQNIKESISRSVLNYANANLAKTTKEFVEQQTLSEKERTTLLSSQNKLARVQGAILSLDFQQKSATLQSDIKRILNENELSVEEKKILIRNLTAVTEMNEFKNDTKEIQFAIDAISTVSGLALP